MLRAPTPPFLLAGLALAGLAGGLIWSARYRVGRHAPNEQILGIVSTSRIQSLDPQQPAQTGTVAIRNRLLQALREGLVEFDPRVQAPVPAMAESWDISPDHRTAVFHLRAGLRWNNGDPLVAGDFVFAIRRAFARFSRLSESLAILKNGSELSAGRRSDPAVLGATALDDRTLRLEFEHPVPGLLMELCDPAWMPLHAATVVALEDGSYWTHPTRLVTNGPFELAEANPDKVTLRPNPFYRARGEIRLAQVEFQYAEDASLYELVLRSGKAQLSDRLASGEISVPRDAGIEVWRDPTLAVGSVHFNLRRGPLADRRVRQALSLALDRAVMAREISTANVRPARTCLPPVADWEDVRTVREDLGEARRLLAEAGFPGGRNLPVLRWPYRSAGTEASVRLPEICAEQWRERLGLQVYLLPVDEEDFQHRVASHDYDLILGPIVGTLPDLTHLASELTSSTNSAYSGWDGSAVVKLVERAREADAGQVHNRILAV
ncbi:MAG TPA: peptide ABC transporter substrate-binding protein, partial [Candidatus Didemnitutus sp.]